LGCKASGYVGNATRIWGNLDADGSGEISMVELEGDLASQPEDTAALPVPEDFGDTGEPQ
jgi:hypothetical protein